MFVCNRGDIAVTAGSEHGSLANPLWEPVLDVFPYTIARAAMRDTAVGIWSALERGNRGQHRPGWAPRVRQGAILTTGLVRTLLGHQLSSRWTPVHKPSSNSGNPEAWFTDSATKSCLRSFVFYRSKGNMFLIKLLIALTVSSSFVSSQDCGVPRHDVQIQKRK